MSVVLPAPFGPSRPKNSPSSTARSTPSRACTLPKRRATSVTSTASMASAGRESEMRRAGNRNGRDELRGKRSTGQQFLDAVDMGQREDAGRHRREGQRRAFGMRAPLQRHHHRERRGIGVRQVRPGRRCRLPAARRPRDASNTAAASANVSVPANVQPSRRGRKAAAGGGGCAVDHDLPDAPLFLSVSVLMRPSTPPPLICSLNSSR